MSEPRQWVCHFNDPWDGSLAGDPASWLGAKAANLCRLVQAGFDVPAGFVVSSAACRQYLRLGNSLPTGLWDQIVDGVRRLERETGLGFGDSRQPLLLAVRGGAAVSMPGVLETLLNCGLTAELAEAAGRQADYLRFIEAFSGSRADVGRGPASPNGAGSPSSVAERLAEYARQTGQPLPQDVWELLLQSVCAVMDSWQRPRATRYRAALGIPDDLATAVIVQVMFPSEVSGVLFTRPPDQPSDRQLVVEAIAGLGEALVSGAVTPERVLLDRDRLAAELTTRDERAAAEQQLDARDRCGHDSPQSRLGAPSTAELPKAESPTAESPTAESPVPELPAAERERSSLLSAEQLRRLGQLGLKLEQEFGFAVDVEWGAAGRRLVVLQARPIPATPQPRQRLPPPRSRRVLVAEVARLRQLAGQRPTLWVRHSLSETLAVPTPLTWDIVRRFMSVDGGYGRLYVNLGYSPARAVRRQGFLVTVCGRIYADTERLAQLFVGGLPLRYEADAKRLDPSQIEQAPRCFDPAATSGWFLLQLPAMAWVLWRARRRIARWTPTAARRFDQLVLPEFLAFLERERARKLSELAWEGLSDLLEQRIERGLHQFGAESLLPGLLGSLAWDSCERQLHQLLGATEGAALARRLIGGLAPPEDIDQQVWLSRAAQGQVSLDELLARFGHRAAGEMELATPRWREEPTAVTQGLRWIHGTATSEPELQRAAAQADCQLAAEQLQSRLREEGGSSFWPGLERDLAAAAQLIPYREVGKHYLMAGYELIRQVIEEMARRTDLGGDVYFLQLEELKQANRDSERFRRLAQRRRRRRADLMRIEVPPVVDPKCLDQLGSAGEQPGEHAAWGPALSGLIGSSGGRGEPVTDASRDSDWLAGSSLSSGIGRGPALVVDQPDLAIEPQPGYVLICRAIDPGLIPLLLGASALVVELGGLLSHGAVLARQLGIPAVVCAGIRRSGRSSGQIVVDGDAGRVRWE